MHNEGREDKIKRGTLCSTDACLCKQGRDRELKSKGAVLTGFLQITGSLTAMESNGAGRAESITGHNRFSHRSELGKAVLFLQRRQLAQSIHWERSWLIDIYLYL